ncbi:hypothetical protein RHSIM_Rhsim11G0140300 [Rhododendron simsii]|uniref:Legume lectin domain-containing protein n=1 Tax=Rhododendron simsii TaxID=118357 RepID=A0A834L9R4_RHOSS|nr:hypothetical protein RHSIM_Rhsim11G0140300 [Rhododendron simsii]
MAIFNFKILLYSLSMFFFCILFPQTTSLTFNLTNFNDHDQKSNITTYGDAYISPRIGLQLTSNELNNSAVIQVGKATYIEPLHLWDNSTGNLTDFSTHFVFVIDSVGSENFGDGMTFFLAPKGSSFTTGGFLGLPIDPNTTIKTSPFVAVEFDTFGNIMDWDGWDPINVGQAPHVGIDVNSITSNVTAIWYCNITNGTENEAWIRYDPSSYNLSVVFTTSNSRVKDSIHLIVDLRNYLPEWVTFGFSASSGMYFEKNTVKSWEFSSSLEIKETNKTGTETNKTVTVNTGNRNVTDPVKPGSKKISLGAVVGSFVGSGVLVGGFVLVGFSLWRRSRAKEEDEFEVEMTMENEFESGAGMSKGNGGMGLGPLWNGKVTRSSRPEIGP